MAKFFYKMQNILNIKEKLEEQARNDFAVAANALKDEEAKLAGLVARKEEYEDKLAGLYMQELRLTDIKETQNAVEIMKYQIQVQMVSVKNAEIQLENARIKLEEAIKERKTHDRLKEKAFEEFKAELQKEESKEIDELVSYRFGQKE